MACLSPRDMWPPAPGAQDGRYVSSPSKSYAGAQARKIPCGQCVGCRLGKAQDWSTRVMHEFQMAGGVGAFITVTYAPEHLPADRSLSTVTHQEFMKRLRYRFGSFRFFGCGEYGSKHQRPHYHYILFGLEFPDMIPWKRSETGETLFRSPALDEAWGLGHVWIGQVTLRSAEYVARYTLKKLKHGASEDERLARVDPATGEVFSVRPEFLVMSRRPGIGAGWIAEFSADAFPSDFVVVDGRKRPVPRFYARRLSEMDALRRSTRLKAEGRKRADDNRDSRLLVRKEVRELRAARLVRDMGGDE